MNAVADAESSYWTTNLKKKTKKGSGVTMMPYSFIGLEGSGPFNIVGKTACMGRELAKIQNCYLAVKSHTLTSATLRNPIMFVWPFARATSRGIL